MGKKTLFSFKGIENYSCIHENVYSKCRLPIPQFYQSHCKKIQLYSPDPPVLLVQVLDETRNKLVRGLRVSQSSIAAEPPGVRLAVVVHCDGVVWTTSYLDNLGCRERSDLLGFRILLNKQRNLQGSILVSREGRNFKNDISALKTQQNLDWAVSKVITYEF